MPSRGSPNGPPHTCPQPNRAGRDRPEQVVVIDWNGWSSSIGTGGRHHPVRTRDLAVLRHGDRTAKKRSTLDGPLTHKRNDLGARLMGATTTAVFGGRRQEGQMSRLTDCGPLHGNQVTVN